MSDIIIDENQKETSTVANDELNEVYQKLSVVIDDIISNSIKENFSKLELTQKLEKLDILQDEETLKRLERIESLNPTSKEKALNFILGLVLDFLKFFTITIFVIFCLNFDSGRKIASNLFSIVGFGDSSKVNLGLQLIQGNINPNEMDSLLKNMELRIDHEISTIFSNSSSVNLEERIKTLDQVQSYFFINSNYNLNKYQEDKIQKIISEKSNLLPRKIDFEINRLKNTSPEVESSFREIKILFMQKSYGNLLARAMPLWNKSEPIRMAIIIAIVELKRNDPESFELILNNLKEQGLN